MRHREVQQTRGMAAGWSTSWDRTGLGMWTARLHEDARVVGYGGCALMGDVVWNFGYRIAADHHGRGYATELARATVRCAAEVDASLPVVAYLLDINVASATVAERVGMALAYHGPDAGNPDPSATRLVYSDRALTPAELDAATA